MSGPDRRRGLRALVLAAALLGLLPVLAALAADRSDRSFGKNGVVNLPPPQEARELRVGPVVWDLADGGDGKMVAALADFSSEGSYIAAARFGRDGALDRSFGEGGFAEAVGVREGVLTGLKTTQAQAVAVQRDGKVVLVGYQQGQLSKTAPALARFRADGTLDPAFGDGGVVAPRPREVEDEALHGVAIQPQGRIIAVGGKREHQEGQPAALVTAYRSDGSIDRGFGRRGRLLFPTRRGNKEYTGFREVQVLPGGKLLAAGYLRGRLFLVRLTGDGRLDHGFGGDGKVVLDVGANEGCVGDCGLDAPFVRQRDGRILVAANLSLGSSVLVRLRPDGRLDRGYGSGGVVRLKKDFFRANGLALDGAGRLVVAGIDERVVSRRDVRIVFATLRFLPSGRIDRGFGRNGSARLTIGESSAAFAALAQPNGRVVVGGGAQTHKDGRTGHRLLLTRYLNR